MNECYTSGILFDHGRTARIGLPEAVFGQGKSLDALLELFEKFAGQTENPILFTRIAPDVFQSLPDGVRGKYQYHQLSQTAFSAARPKMDYGRVAVVSAGTADGRSTWEAARTLEYLGVDYKVFEDNGVAGLWRLTANLEEINGFDVVIIVAGWI